MSCRGDMLPMAHRLKTTTRKRRRAECRPDTLQPRRALVQASADGRAYPPGPANFGTLTTSKQVQIVNNLNRRLQYCTITTEAGDFSR
jgi:hypothetical protein